MLKKIVLLIVISNVYTIDWMAVQKKGPLPDLPADICEVGKNYKFRCNVCECIPPGIPKCGTLSCMGDQERGHGDAKNGCVVGTAFHDYCNICNCNTGVHAICTKIHCLEHDM